MKPTMRGQPRCFIGFCPALHPKKWVGVITSKNSSIVVWTKSWSPTCLRMKLVDVVLPSDLFSRLRREYVPLLAYRKQKQMLLSRVIQKLNIIIIIAYLTVRTEDHPLPFHCSLIVSWGSSVSRAQTLFTSLSSLLGWPDYIRSAIWYFITVSPDQRRRCIHSLHALQSYSVAFCDLYCDLEMYLRNLNAPVLVLQRNVTNNLHNSREFYLFHQ